MTSKAITLLLLDMILAGAIDGAGVSRATHNVLWLLSALCLAMIAYLIYTELKHDAGN